MLYPFSGEDENGGFHIGSLIEQDGECYILTSNDGRWFSGEPTIIYPVKPETVKPRFKIEEEIG